MAHFLRPTKAVSYNDTFRIQANRQPIVKTLDFSRKYETWWGEQQANGKAFVFLGSNHCHILGISKLVKVDDESQIWGKTITNNHIEEEDRLRKDELPAIYWLDAAEADLKYLLKIRWVTSKEIEIRRIPPKYINVLKFDVGDECWHQPPQCLYCDHTNCKCPRKPVRVIIEETHPHVFMDQMRAEYRYSVKYKNRRKINDGWCDGSSLKLFIPNTPIESWTYDEDDIHIDNLRRSITYNKYNTFKTISRVPENNRPRDCKITSAFFGKFEVFAENKHIINQLANDFNPNSLSESECVIIIGNFKHLIVKNIQLQKITSFKLKNNQKKTLKNRGMASTLNARGMREDPLSFDFKMKTFLILNNIELNYTEKYIDFTFSLDFLTDTIELNPIIHETKANSQIRLVSGIEFRFYRKQSIIMPKKLEYIKINRHQVKRFLRNIHQEN